MHGAIVSKQVPALWWRKWAIQAEADLQLTTQITEMNNKHSFVNYHLPTAHRHSIHMLLLCHTTLHTNKYKQIFQTRQRHTDTRELPIHDIHQ